MQEDGRKEDVRGREKEERKQVSVRERERKKMGEKATKKGRIQMRGVGKRGRTRYVQYVREKKKTNVYSPKT